MIRFALILFLFLFCITSGRSQSGFDCDVRDGLFRGLENPVTFHSENTCTVLLKSGDSVRIVKISGNEFTVEPTCRAKEITLFAVDSITNDTLQQQDFKLRSIPPFKLYVGNVSDSMETHLLPNALISYHAREFVPNNKTYRVLSFTVEVNGEVMEFYGDRVPKETVEELYKLRRTFGTPNLTIRVQAKILCSDCVARNVSTYIILI